MTVLAINIGNTRVRLGIRTGEDFIVHHVFDHQQFKDQLPDILPTLTQQFPDVSLAIGSVVPVLSMWVRDIARVLSLRVYEIGKEVDVPLSTNLAENSGVGMDRLLNGLAAWSLSAGACWVVDAGTATTMDYLDKEGVFQGGIIAPGAQMMLDILAQRATLLPSLEFNAHMPSYPLGKHTSHAMQAGVVASIRGLIHELNSAENRTGMIWVTGGNASEIFAAEIADSIYSHESELALIGITIAVTKYLETTG